MDLRASKTTIHSVSRSSPILLIMASAVIIATIWSTLLIIKPKQETLDQRVQNVAVQLKCPVCQGESVADSQATIAQQMRQVIREQLQSGKSEQEVIQYFVRSYGDQIVWLPLWQGFSLLVWLVPIVFLLGGVVLVCIVLHEGKSGVAMAEVNEIASDKRLPLDPDLDQYRAQLTTELAEEDTLFRHDRTKVK